VPWFTHLGSSNGPAEAINEGLEQLRGIALGFGNLANFQIRSQPRSRPIEVADPLNFVRSQLLAL